MRSSKDSLYFSDIKDCFLCPEDIFSKDDMDQIPDPQSLITEWIYLLLEQVPLIPVRSWLLCNMCVEYGYYGEDLSINLLSPPLCKAPALTITLSIGRNLYSDTLFLFLSSSLQAHYAKDPPTPLVLPSTGNTSNIAFGDLSISVPVSTAIDNLDTRLVPSGNVLRDYHCLTHQDSRYCIVPPPEFRYTIGDITFRNGTHNTEDFSLFLSWIQFMLSYLASDYTARKTLLKNLYHIEFQAFRRILDNDTLEQNYRTPEDFSELLDSLCFLMDTCIQLLRPNSTLLQTVYDRAKRKKNGMLWKEKQICVISQGKHIESQVLSMIMRFEVVSENTIRVRISYNVPTKPEKRTNSPHLWISTTPNLRSEDFKPLTNML